jgi:hypothetical protein
MRVTDAALCGTFVSKCGKLCRSDLQVPKMHHTYRVSFATAIREHGHGSWFMVMLHKASWMPTWFMTMET